MGSIHHIVMSESLKFFHKSIFNQEPFCLNKYFIYSLNRSDVVRLIRKPRLAQPPKTEMVAQSLLFRVVYLYNKLPDVIRVSNTKQFSANINKQLKILFPLCEIPKNKQI